MRPLTKVGATSYSSHPSDATEFPRTFRGDVIRWDPQPVRLPLEDSARSYTPDVLVTYAKPGPRGMTEHRVLYEVKYREELRAKWKEYRPRFKAASQYARAQGWQFKLVTEREIRAGGLLLSTPR
jgi:TnsA endonuclease-like protein